MRSTHLVTWLAAILTIVSSAPAGAQNLLSNPDFAGTISPWAACGDGTIFLTSDRAGCSDTSSIGAGAAQVDCGLGSASYEVGIRQCVPLAGSGLVAGSSKVFFSGWVFVEQNVTAGIALRYFSNADCTAGGEISAVLAGGSGYVGIWKFWAPLNPVTVPAGTLSIEYQAIGIDHDGNMFFAFFDDAYLGTATALYTDGFEHASPTPCHWNGFAP